MTKSVAIRALSKHSQPDVMPLVDEVWAINNAAEAYSFRADLIIAMDDLARDFKMAEHKHYVRSIVEHGCPVYSARADKRWPTVRPYPLAKVLDALELDKNAWPLFDNTLNYAFALAIAEGFTKIFWFGADWRNTYDPLELQVAFVRWRLRGYDPPDWFVYHDKIVNRYASNTEPGSEAFHWWLGLACHDNIEVLFPPGCTILNRDRVPHWYGYNDTDMPELPDNRKKLVLPRIVDPERGKWPEYEGTES